MSASSVSESLSDAPVNKKDIEPVTAVKSDNSSSPTNPSKTEATQELVSNGALQEDGQRKNGSDKGLASDQHQATSATMNGQDDKSRAETPHREVPGLLPLQPLSVTGITSCPAPTPPNVGQSNLPVRQPPPPLLPMKVAGTSIVPVVATKSAPPPAPSSPSSLKGKETKVKPLVAVPSSSLTPSKERKDSTSKQSNIQEKSDQVHKETRKRKTNLKKRHSIGSSDSTGKRDLESNDGDGDSGRKSKRARTKTQPFQSSDMDPNLLKVIKATAVAAQQQKSVEEKLAVFFKGEFLAVRNAEGGFYVCQATQNIYRGSHKIRIRWLSQVEKKDVKSKGQCSRDDDVEENDETEHDIYTPDFYDNTDFECILTNLELEKLGKDRYGLPVSERQRTENILRRAIEVEQGVFKNLEVTEEHPDGLDVSLFHDESQLTRKSRGKGRKEDNSTSDSDLKDDAVSGSSGRSTEPTTSSSGCAYSSADASTSSGRGTKRTRAAALAAARNKVQIAQMMIDDDEDEDDDESSDEDAEDLNPEEEDSSSESDDNKRRRRRSSPRAHQVSTRRTRAKRRASGRGKKSSPRKIAPIPLLKKRTRSTREEAIAVKKKKIPAAKFEKEDTKEEKKMIESGSEDANKSESEDAEKVVSGQDMSKKEAKNEESSVGVKANKAQSAEIATSDDGAGTKGVSDDEPKNPEMAESGTLAVNASAAPANPEPIKLKKGEVQEEAPKKEEPDEEKLETSTGPKE